MTHPRVNGGLSKAAKATTCYAETEAKTCCLTARTKTYYTAGWMMTTCAAGRIATGWRVNRVMTKSMGGAGIDVADFTGSYGEYRFGKLDANTWIALLSIDHPANGRIVHAKCVSNL